MNDSADLLPVATVYGGIRIDRATCLKRLESKDSPMRRAVADLRPDSLIRC